MSEEGPLGISRLGVAEAMQSVVVDAEVMRHFVHDGDPDLLDELLLALTHVEKRSAENEDPVGQRDPGLTPALGQRHAVVEAEQVLGLAFGGPLFDEDDDVAHQRRKLFGDAVEGLVHESVEADGIHLNRRHQAIQHGSADNRNAPDPGIRRV